jgi:hypothetical protein
VQYRLAEDVRGGRPATRATKIRLCRAVGLVLLAWWAPGTAASSPPSGTARVRPLRAPSIYDRYGRVAVNDLDFVTTNFGSFGYRTYSGEPGLTYPRGAATSVLFAGGIWVSSSAGGVVRQAVAEYFSEFQGGTAPGGTASPDDPRFRNYTLFRGDTTSVDYVSWPVQDGAPVDALGRPLLTGDETIWSVSNDADAFFHYGSTPLGVEVRQSTFAYVGTPGDPNTIYLKFSVRNPGSAEIDSAFVGLWLDPDLGGYDDDLAGCDTTLALGYCYNETNADAQYGASPPALGVALLQGPIIPAAAGGAADTLGLYAFNAYAIGDDPNGPAQRQASLEGRHADGTPMTEYDSPWYPVTRYRYSGDPVTTSGWLDAVGGDRRLLLSTGPFTLPPGATREIVAALIVGQGSDRLSSVTDLRARTDAARALYRAGFPESGTPVPILAAPGGALGFTGQPLTFLVRLLGDDSNAWTLQMDQGPPGATFEDLGGNTGRFTWTPAIDQIGISSARFTASRAGLPSQSAATDLDILRPNQGPVFSPIPDFIAYFGQTTVQPFEADDPDGDHLVTADCSLQFWAPRVIEETASAPGHVEGVIRVTLPPFRSDQDAEIDVPSRLCVYDSFGGAARADFVIHARRPQLPPEISARAEAEGVAGDFFSVSAFASDANSTDTLDLWVSGAPASLHLVQEIRREPDYGVYIDARLQGVLGPGDIGTHTVIWHVSDGQFPDAVDTTVLRITPRPTTPPPPSPLTAPATTFPISLFSVGMSAGDFDGDGLSDVATIARSPDFALLDIALGDAEGGFALPVSIYLGQAWPLAVASGDWDHDGDSDLVVACDSSSTLRYFRSGGNGTFDESLVDPGVAIPVALAAGDFDGDGAVDLVVGSAIPTGLAFLRGDGAGGFAPAGFSATAATPRSMILFDFNRDGAMDLAAACPGANTVYVLFGPLDASPLPEQSIVTVNFPRALVGGDFTHDGVVDLVAVGSGLLYGASAVLLRGQPDGRFVAGAPVLINENSIGYSAASGDFDGDGNRDLALGFSNYSIYAPAPPLSDPYDLHAPSSVLETTGCSLLLGHGDGTFGPPFDLCDRCNVFGLDASDADGDGRDDLLLGSLSLVGAHGSLWKIMGQPGAALSEPPGVGMTGTPTAIVLADFDADGDADLAAIRGDDLLTWANRGDATFSGPAVARPNAFPAPRVLESGDFNGDGFADLVSAADELRPTLIQGLGGPAGPPAFYGGISIPDSVDRLVIEELRAAVAFDLDEDGYDDLVLRATCRSPTGYQHALLLFHGGPSGLAYERGVATGVYTSLGYSPEPLLVQPGRIQLVHPTDFQSSKSSLTVSAWDSLLRPLGSLDLPPNRAGYTAALGDFDGDGVSDVAFGGVYSTTGILGITVFPRNADGSMRPPTVVHGSREISDLIARDFNSDGIMDLAGLDRTGGSAILEFGRAGGMLDPSASVGYALPSNPTLLAAGDLNRDGAIDLAAACPSAGRIAFLFNQTSAAPAALLERLDTEPDRVSLLWRTIAAPGSRATVIRIEVDRGGSATFAATVSGDSRVAFEDSTVRAGTAYLYSLRVRRATSEATTPPTRVDVPESPNAPPSPLAIQSVVPNPVRESAVIRWTLPAAGRVTLRVFDVHGRVVDTVIDGFSAGGPHEIQWMGRASSGARLASGVYWLRLESAEGTRTRKVVLAR